MRDAPLHISDLPITTPNSLLPSPSARRAACAHSKKLGADPGEMLPVQERQKKPPRRSFDLRRLTCEDFSFRPYSSAPQPLGPSPARSAPGIPKRPGITRASTGLRASAARSNASTAGRHTFSPPREHQMLQLPTQSARDRPKRPREVTPIQAKRGCLLINAGHGSDRRKNRALNG